MIMNTGNRQSQSKSQLNNIKRNSTMPYPSNLENFKSMLQNNSKSSTNSLSTSTNASINNQSSKISSAAAVANDSSNNLSERSRRLAKELEEFVERGMKGITATENGEEGAPSAEAAAELQIQIAGMFRKIFPGNRELLYLVSEKNWMALLLTWMNQYNRPKVQVEAMLSLTTITDLCQQQFYQNPHSQMQMQMQMQVPMQMMDGVGVMGGKMNVGMGGMGKKSIGGIKTGLEAIQNARRNASASGNPHALLNAEVRNVNMKLKHMAPGGNLNVSGNKAGAIQNALASLKNSGVSSKPGSGSISDRVKNIMNQSKDTSGSTTSMTTSSITTASSSTTTTTCTMSGNILVRQTTEHSSKKMGATMFKKTSSVVNSLLTKAICQSSGNDIPSPMNVDNDRFVMKNKVLRSDDDDDSDQDGSDDGMRSATKSKSNQHRPPTAESALESSSQSQKWPNFNDPSTILAEATKVATAFETKVATAIEKEKNHHNTPLPETEQVELTFDNMKKQGYAENKERTRLPATKAPIPTPPSKSTLSPAILSALQNMPPNVSGSGAGNGTSPIPLVGNYTQPLSVTSNNLLVQHPEAIPSFISLMTSPDKDVCENAMWVLGNIAAGEGSGVPGSAAGGSNGNGSLGDMNIGDKSSLTVKDIVLAAGAMGPLLRCMERFTDAISLQRIGSWVISTLVETKLPAGKKSSGSSNSDSNSRIDEIDLIQLLNTLRRVIQLDDDDILSYTCWSLSHLCDGPPSNIAAVVTTLHPNDAAGGLVPRLVELLHHGNWRVTKPALRTIGNIVCAEYDEDAVSALDDKPVLTDFTEVILECDAVPRLKALINHANREIQKEACWTLSNIAAGTVDQIQAVIDSGAIPPLVKLVNNENTDQEVRSEACWVVLNATSCGSDQQIGVLVSEGCVSVLGLLLEETNMVTMALEGLERVLQVEEAREAAWRESQIRTLGNSNNHVRPPSPLVSASLIEKALNKNHNKSAVTKRAQKIWNEHFVSCALCNQPYSKHRFSEAKFCQECKCYVCHNCNCEVYHLSYQEELWATPEEKKGAKSKKSKNKKKKEKRKEKNKIKAQETKVSASEANNVESTSSMKTPTKSKTDPISGKNDIKAEIPVSEKSTRNISDDGEKKAEETDNDLEISDVYPAVDFNKILQQTGSIIAVSRLMDALDEQNAKAETSFLAVDV